ncbi:unnamed protein product [Ilex paraguariensis]|uniref:Fe2OG dioxygenase domain-containing protein n=1 Tax=Ilex paraguariensis TaxID=185542 RepID=A0ABC8V220_9AQUA
MAPVVSPVVSNSLDVTNIVVNEGHGVKGLAEMSLETLPEKYIQPLEERISTSKEVEKEFVPLIDVANWDDPKVLESICNAAEKWGCFQIVNHGVAIDVLDNLKDATHRFFGLPVEEKRKYLKEHSLSTNVRLATSFNAQVDKALEWRDFLSLFYVSDDEAAAFWPPVCKDEALAFLKSSEFVIRKLFEVLMKRLNVKEINETKQSLLMGSKKINLNYYPKCPNPELTIGVGRHSDINTLTILLQDDIGGLYVRKTDGDTDSWIPVLPISGSLVINVGDALEIMSNGRYKSIEHCVTANGSKNRVSVPIFVSPRPSDVIGPLPEVLESGEEAMYKQVAYSDYMKHFFNKALDGKGTLELAKI